MEIRNLEANEIECRVARVTERSVQLLLYKDARCDMNILDEVFGSMNWKKEYSRDNANCTVSIWDEKKEQWISKEDTGTESFTEKEKGLASDSFKRACVNWGIGRELYSAPDIYFPLANTKGEYDEKNKKGKCFDRFIVESIEYDGKKITKVVVLDKTTGEKHVATNFIGSNSKTAEDLKTEMKISKAKANAMLERLKNADPEKLKSAKISMSAIKLLYKIESIEDLTESQHTDLSIALSKAGV